MKPPEVLSEAEVEAFSQDPLLTPYTRAANVALIQRIAAAGAKAAEADVLAAYKVFKEAEREIIRGAIERCAKIAEGWGGRSSTEIAAAIRDAKEREAR